VRLRWYGQSAFLLAGERHRVFVDPFGDLSGSSMGWRYPPITGARAELDGLRIAHFGDFGQSELRPEQAAAIGAVDLLLVPVGGGPTVGAAGAHAIVERLRPRLAVPMHYRTPAIDFLEPADAFLERFGRDVVRWDGPEGELPGAAGALVPAPPAA
jgi:L-ascorbate metabolism protein UlaG (beta-lactamase superfamily)